MLCKRWFKEKSLQEIINDNKGRELKEKYNINNYLDNRGKFRIVSMKLYWLWATEKILFHELAHAATVTKRYNDLLDVEDISIRLTQYAKDNIKPGIYANQEAWVTAYGPLNAKILARTISDGNFDWVSIWQHDPTTVSDPRVMRLGRYYLFSKEENKSCWPDYRCERTMTIGLLTLWVSACRVL